MKTSFGPASALGAIVWIVWGSTIPGAMVIWQLLFLMFEVLVCPAKDVSMDSGK